jgi:hypothetical protein
MTQKYGPTQDSMLRAPPADPLSPHPEGGRFHLLAHQIDDGGLIQAKLGLNCLKGRTIFPCHFDNARDGGIAQGRSIADAAMIRIGHHNMDILF